MYTHIYACKYTLHAYIEKGTKDKQYDAVADWLILLVQFLPGEYVTGARQIIKSTLHL